MRITGGNARGVSLTVPRAQRVRPTSDRVRSALFQLLGLVVVDARVLDLYAGTGALGIEALSRGAASVDFVEANPRLCDIVARNMRAAGFDQIGRVYRAKVDQALEFLTPASLQLLQCGLIHLPTLPRLLTPLHRFCFAAHMTDSKYTDRPAGLRTPLPAGPFNKRASTLIMDGSCPSHR